MSGFINRDYNLMTGQEGQAFDYWKMESKRKITSSILSLNIQLLYNLRSFYS